MKGIEEHPSARLSDLHRLAWAECRAGGALGVSHLVECICGAQFVRARLSDAATALERHQARPALNPGDGHERPEGNALPTGNRRRARAGDQLPSEAAEAERAVVQAGRSLRS